MLNSEDRRAIEGLFSRLADIERRTPDRDPEAERLIAREIDRQPGAPYYLAQTVLVQEHALEVAEKRIRELEQKVEDAGRRTLDRPRGPWERDDRGAQDERDDRSSRRGFGVGGFGGGGFLAGAAQTAMGVAGGVLLGSAIGSLFGGGSAHAAESPANDADQNTDANADTGNDSADTSDAGSDNDFGGDSGDFGGDGGFDMGGDF